MSPFRDDTLRRALLCALACAGALTAHAKGDSEKLYAPVAEAGLTLHSGTSTKSLAGSTGYFVILRSEEKKGIFRLHVATQFDYSAGTANLNGSTPKYTMYGAGFLAGCHIALLDGARFTPFFGGNGILAWDYFKMPSPPTGVEANTQGLSFGYEVSAGVDIRFGNKAGSSLRIRGGYWQVSSAVAGQSGFLLNGFRLGLGGVFN